MLVHRYHDVKVCQIRFGGLACQTPSISLKAGQNFKDLMKSVELYFALCEEDRRYTVNDLLNAPPPPPLISAPYLINAPLS